MIKKIRPLKRQPMLKAEVAEKVPNKSEKAEKSSKSSKLPTGVYKDEIDPIDLEVDEYRKFVLSVKRGGEFGLPMCDIRQYQTTDLYTGFTKKGVNFPVELLLDLIESLQEVYNECVEKELV